MSTVEFEGERELGSERQNSVAIMKRRVWRILDREPSHTKHKDRKRNIWATMIVNVGGHDALDKQGR